MSGISGILAVSDDFVEVNPVPWIRGSLDSCLFYESMERDRERHHSFRKRIPKGFIKTRKWEIGKDTIHSNKRILKGFIKQGNERTHLSFIVGAPVHPFSFNIFFNGHLKKYIHRKGFKHFFLHTIHYFYTQIWSKILVAAIDPNLLLENMPTKIRPPFDYLIILLKLLPLFILFLVMAMPLSKSILLFNLFVIFAGNSPVDCWKWTLFPKALSF